MASGDHKSARRAETIAAKKRARKAEARLRMRPRLGGGGMPDVFNPRTGKFEWGRVTKPDRRS